MSIQSKLYNPTPFDVKLDYERGIRLVIPADGSLELTMGQLDDFRPGKPGSEEVRRTLDWYGLFLRDPDLSFDSQALKALKASRNSKKSQYDAFVTSVRDQRTALGREPDDDTLNALKAKSGYGQDGLEGQIVALEARIEMLEKEQVSESSAKTIEQLDPELTCFGVQPPRQFETKLQLKMFMTAQPKEIIEKHEAFVAALEDANEAD